jgi:hypothetical protein
MKKYFLFILFFIAQTIFAQDLTNQIEYQKLVKIFISYIKNNKREQISNLVIYPLNRDYPLPSIKNKKEFLKRYDEIFDANLIEMIVISNPIKDWGTAGWRGISFTDGKFWLDYDGNLIGVNYQSKIEKAKKVQLIISEKNKLHESVKTFKSPVLILETKKVRVRIDDLGNGNYRYASWSIKNDMSTKPDLILKKGEINRDGTGGNHSYIFKNGEYSYECSIIIMGEDDSPPAMLTVSKGDAIISNSDAKIVE